MMEQWSGEMPTTSVLRRLIPGLAVPTSSRARYAIGAEAASPRTLS
jgi:hypothetical protein